MPALSNLPISRNTRAIDTPAEVTSSVGSSASPIGMISVEARVYLFDVLTAKIGGKERIKANRLLKN